MLNDQSNSNLKDNNEIVFNNSAVKEQPTE